MHAGIVENHDGEGIGVFLGHKLVKRFDDRLGRHRFRGGVVDQLPGSAEEPQYIQPSAMGVGGYLAGLADGTPCVWHRR